MLDFSAINTVIAPGQPGIGNVMIEYTGKDCNDREQQGLCHPQLTLLDHNPVLVMDMWKSTGNENDYNNLCHL
jgi:hypothetical protein